MKKIKERLMTICKDIFVDEIKGSEEIFVDKLLKNAKAKLLLEKMSDIDLHQLIKEEYDYVKKKKMTHMKKIIKFKLYKVVIGYFKENKTDYPRSHGGETYYHASASSSKEAKDMALKVFKKEYGDKFDTISAEASIIKLPKIISLTGSGILIFR